MTRVQCVQWAGLAKLPVIDLYLSFFFGEGSEEDEVRGRANAEPRGVRMDAMEAKLGSLMMLHYVRAYGPGI